MNINTDDVLKSRAVMEAKIQRAVNDAIAEFKKDTGLTPSYIGVPMNEITEFGSNCREYIPGMVECVVDITFTNR